MIETDKIINASGWCNGELGPLGPLVPNKIMMIDHSGLLRFEAHTGNTPVSGQVVIFELPANIQTGKHDGYARAFGIHRYGGEAVENWRGVSGFIELIFNRAKQEFSATLDYVVRAPDQSEFTVNIELGILGFNQIIIPS
jgi:hypothetical protein